MLRAVVLTQYRRVTDRQTGRQTGGIAVASTALAMRALRRAVKTHLFETAQSDRAVAHSTYLLAFERIIRYWFTAK